MKLTQKQLLDVFTDEQHVMSSTHIAAAMGTTDLERVWHLSMRCQDRGLLTSTISPAHGLVKLYTITAAGMVERSKVKELKTRLPRSEPVTSETNHFQLGRLRRLQNWAAILGAMPADQWIRATSICRAAEAFYVPNGTRKALREMEAEGLVEVTGCATHRKLKLYRPTQAGADFARSSNV